jgi:hypothetical protein
MISNHNGMAAVDESFCEQDSDSVLPSPNAQHHHHMIDACGYIQVNLHCQPQYSNSIST